MYAGESVFFPSTGTSTGTGLHSLSLSCASSSGFPVFLLVHLLRGALPFIVEFDVFGVDLGLAILGFPASAGTVSH